jgi:O-antigen/teichoic acid export membrane protein
VNLGIRVHVPVDPPLPQGSRVSRTLKASGWMYSSRFLVFVWALLITHTFGIEAYGVYAMAFAAGSLLGVPLDSYFTTRGPRVTKEVFLRERTTRAIFGFSLIMLGVIAWPFSIIIGFAVIKAGSDVAFQASRSSLIRDGQPDRAQRADAIRQVLGMALGSSYLLLAQQPDLRLGAALYLTGTALPVLLGLQAMTHARPSFPEINLRSFVILAESGLGVAYVQCEVLILGVLGHVGEAGYYSFGATLVWSLAALGQSFGTTFHGDLRASHGHVSAGPQLRTALGLSLATAGALALFALGAWLFEGDTSLWLTFAILIPVSFLRTLSSVATVVLVLQHRDRFRLTITAISIAVKIGLVLLLSGLGGPGAAIAFLVADMIMSGAYSYAVYGGRGRPAPAA